MQERVLEYWRLDKLYTLVFALWLATLVSAFMGSNLLCVSVPLLGHIYAFRVLLPVTAILYVVWAIRNRESFWKSIPTIEKWCYIFCVVLLIYGAISLFRAIEFMHTFKKLFNLAFDLIFFFLAMRLCRRSDIRKWTLLICLLMLGVLLILGLYEMWNGGIWYQRYDQRKFYPVFDMLVQYPTVFSFNTNDYNMTLIFLFATLLLWTPKHEQKFNWAFYLFIVVFGSFIYFSCVISDARLCQFSFILLVIGLFFYFICSRKRAKIFVVFLLLFGMVLTEFSSRYYYLMPQIQLYWEYTQTQKLTTVPAGPVETISPPPIIDLKDPNSQNIEDELYIINKETGEKEFNTTASAGIRTRLLLHAWDCFLDSCGLGVGLGNTEVSVQDKMGTGEAGAASIHCFIARLIADYGIFALIPMAVIGCLLLLKIIRLFTYAILHRNQGDFGFGILWLTILLIFPIVSTASSDAQDNLCMWLYLAFLMLFTTQTNLRDKITQSDALC